MFGRKSKEIKSLREELEAYREWWIESWELLKKEKEKNDLLLKVSPAIDKKMYTINSTIAERWNNLKKGNIKKYKEKGLVAYNTEWLKNNINMEYDLIAGVNYKKLWYELYNFMNDHALAIGPDELTDPARRLEMQAQYELLLDLLNMMSDMTNEE